MLSTPTARAVKSILSVSLLCASFASADNTTSRLSIHVPHSLYKIEGYQHREALFGIPQYGGSIAQNLYYADSDLCSTVDNRGGYPEREPDETGKQAPWPSPYILMVDRGGCTFVQKVRNAQRTGAAGVIIADNTCLCSDEECNAINDDDSTECQTSEPIMADDGSGSDITIPSFLMFKHDADKVKDEVMQGNVVQIEMTWALPSPDDRVEYDLWTTPTEFASKDILSKFHEVAKALGDHAYFTPHMFIYDGTKNGCNGAGKNQCYTLCTNNGRYCALDPDNDLDAGISGADVVAESLRRLCIWKHYGEEDGIGSEWWDYVNHFMDHCQTSTSFTDKKCIDGAISSAKIDGGRIGQCMSDSGGLESDSTNSVLQDEIEFQQKRGIVILPSAYVNESIIRGSLNVNNVFGAICAGYLEGTKPDICETCSECPDRLTCASTGKCTVSASKSGGNGVSYHTFLTFMFMTFCGFAGFGIYQYRKTQMEMREQVRGILAEYMPLEDQEGGNNDFNPAIDFARRGGESLIQ